ncbi:MAG: hypothetical protein A2508_08300 [Candidatus Lambdaproteobacteria bacterium RIFOXYD12_FULL_49_8]|uniref:Uncharacterized protein n=1 Tax=Candidatus Lambdaproteobacteria bacterium RIFOXYD2_FULL_50_16 TaxID=1817772 RepID=A0A1F6G933_9PROT|nr:MAG: hypothetical protein A2527_05345 [Candidatus Lambdaproteobacteria bacterium RIFOXYD2_FULL_50_16]OGG97776.1 MAG: hypothetical protein A2508_08300 [Candidatus Lambdaproteobacteria bacterium RIFOXYD12_FULL_49_8]
MDAHEGVTEPDVEAAQANTDQPHFANTPPPHPESSAQSADVSQPKKTKSGGRGSAAAAKAAEERKKSELEGELREIEPRAVPRDFSMRVATRITAINEREMDESIASGRVTELVFRNLKDADMHMHYLDMVNLLLSDPDTSKYAATTWAGLIWHEEEHSEYREMLQSLIKTYVDAHLVNARESKEHEDTGKYFSAFATHMGEVFIQMMRISADLYDLVTDIYTSVIKMEMTRDLGKKDEDERKGKKGTSPKKKEEKRNFNPKKLYDDIIDFVSARGDFKSDNLNQKNPNEFIIVLADRMRSTRRYVIQDIMNRHALDKKKQLEKELREREAGAEEVITSAAPFNMGLYYYWVEKRYNFKYLAVEKVRITLQVLGFLMGLIAVGTSYLQLMPLDLPDALLISVMMIGWSKLFCSKFFFIAFYPKDVTAKLEEEVGLFTPVFRKMSKSQMNSFINRQVHHGENNLLLHLMPEYFKYIFAVMPDRNNLLMSKDELNEVLERLEVSIAKYQRGSR